MKEHFDVIIVGAGAAGLMAAAELSRSKKRVLVLEARDRVGGRIHTIGQFAQVPVELGAEFIHELSNDLEEILSEASSAILESTGNRYHLEGRTFVQPVDSWNIIDRRLGKLRIPKPGEDQPMSSLLGSNRTKDDRLLYRFVEGFNAAPADQLSARAFLKSHRQAQSEGGYKSYRPIGGYAAIILGLLDRLEEDRVLIKTDCEVKEIDWNRGRVAVRYRENNQLRRARASAVILTIPPSILVQSVTKRGAIRFSPEIEEKRTAAASIGMGTVVKLVIALQTPISRPELDGAQFIHVEKAEFPTWWTAHPYRSPLLVAWAGGPAASRLTGLNRSSLRKAVIPILARILGTSQKDAMKNIRSLWTHNWQTDPFSRGAYSFVKASNETAPKKLAQPIENTLFFAGEATTSEALGGTVGTAIESGKRAAMEILFP